LKQASSIIFVHNYRGLRHTDYQRTIQPTGSMMPSVTGGAGCGLVQ